MAFSLSASKIELASHPRWAGADVPRSPDMVASVRILVTLKFRFPGGIVGQKFLSVGEFPTRRQLPRNFKGGTDRLLQLESLNFSNWPKRKKEVTAW